MKFWKNLSIARKLYALTGTMAALLIVECVTLRFTMRKISAARAFIGGEGSWSKAQKDAAFSLQRYLTTRNESDYQKFLAHLEIPEADRRARLELQRDRPDLSLVRKNLLLADIHTADVEDVISIIRSFKWVTFVNRALRIWAEGDVLIANLQEAGREAQEIIQAGSRDEQALERAYLKIHNLNNALTILEKEFSNTLSDGSRWIESVAGWLIVLIVGSIGTLSLVLTYFTVRRISRGLAALIDTAQRMSRGDFSHHFDPHTHDEIGTLAGAVNNMGVKLETHYQELETRVAERTLKLSHMAEQNARLYEKTKNAVEQRDEFLSIASHELKTPITALLLQLQVAQRIEKDHEKLFEKSIEQTLKLSSLLDRLLDLTHIRAGRLELNRQMTNLNSLIKNAAEQFSTDANKLGVKISVSMNDNINAEIDPIRISQVLDNLIRNALKYGENSPIEIKLKRTHTEAIIEVIDHGPGIAPNLHEFVFERFMRLKQGDKNVEGLGLGLYISRQIIEAHSGSIQLLSQVGAGCTFIMCLPLLEINAATRPPQTISTKALESGSPHHLEQMSLEVG